jgi:Na+-driven multidrug efflux pump
MAFAVLSVAVCFGMAGGIVSLFLEDMSGELAAYSIRVFRIFTASFLLAGLNVVIGGYFTSVEKAGFATAISLTRSIIAMVGALVLLTMVFGGEGIWWAPMLAEGVCLVMTTVMFMSYWKKTFR